MRVQSTLARHSTRFSSTRRATFAPRMARQEARRCRRSSFSHAKSAAPPTLYLFTRIKPAIGLPCAVYHISTAFHALDPQCTTQADLLFRVGVTSAKERVNRTVLQARNQAGPRWNLHNFKEAVVLSHTCPRHQCPLISSSSAQGSSVRRTFLGRVKSGPCEQRVAQTVVDATPEGAYHLHAPSLLASLYGGMSVRRLGFVVLLREPLERMHSGWHWDVHWSLNRHPEPRNVTSARFRAFMRRLREQLPASYAAAINSPNGTMARERFSRFLREHHALYASLYAWFLEPWFAAFEPRQFCVLPMRWALRRGNETLQLLSRLPGPLSATLNVTPTALHANQHSRYLNGRISHYPPAAAEIGHELASWFHGAYGRPSTAHLCRLLARGLARGLILGGGHGGAGGAFTFAGDELALGEDHVAAALQRHLEASW